MSGWTCLSRYPRWEAFDSWVEAHNTGRGMGGQVRQLDGKGMRQGKLSPGQDKPRFKRKLDELLIIAKEREQMKEGPCSG